MSTKFAFLVLAAALASTAVIGRELTGIGAGAPDAFRDDVWIGGDPLGTQTFSQPLWRGATSCAIRLRACSVEVRRVELLTSTAADLSPNRTMDLNGHALGVSGVVVVERADLSGVFGLLGGATTWTARAEVALDTAGTHSWEVLEPDLSPNAKWLPILPWRFAFSTGADLGASSVPERPTWELIGLGLAGLGSAALLKRAHGVGAELRHDG